MALSLPSPLLQNFACDNLGSVHTCCPSTNACGHQHKMMLSSDTGCLKDIPLFTLISGLVQGHAQILPWVLE